MPKVDLMNEFDFYVYLRNRDVSRKICSDNISRLRRVEKCIADCDLDEEYYKDRCTELLSYFAKKGENDKIKKVLIGNLPIGNYTMNTFKCAIRKYVDFMDEFIDKNE